MARASCVMFLSEKLAKPLTQIAQGQWHFARAKIYQLPRVATTSARWRQVKFLVRMNIVHDLRPQEVNFSGNTGQPDWLQAEASTGTSIMAVEFDGGVIIGADSRATTGAYISNRTADKLTKITDNIYCCRSGAASDTQAIADIVSYHLGFHEMELGTPPLVETAANVFRELCYNYRDSLVAGILVAGWDARKGGQVYSIPIGGMCVRQPISIGGSGSTYVYGYVDANYKPNMSKDESVKLVTNTLALAMSRDGSSGGVIRLGIITEGGVERQLILGDKLPKFYEG